MNQDDKQLIEQLNRRTFIISIMAIIISVVAIVIRSARG